MNLFIAFAIGFVAGCATLWFVGDWFGNYAEFRAGLRGSDVPFGPSNEQVAAVIEITNRVFPGIAKLRTLVEVVAAHNGDLDAALDEAIERARTRGGHVP